MKKLVLGFIMLSLINLPIYSFSDEMYAPTGLLCAYSGIPSSCVVYGIGNKNWVMAGYDPQFQAGFYIFKSVQQLIPGVPEALYKSDTVNGSFYFHTYLNFNPDLTIPGNKWIQRPGIFNCTDDYGHNCPFTIGSK